MQHAMHKLVHSGLAGKIPFTNALSGLRVCINPRMYGLTTCGSALHTNMIGSKARCARMTAQAYWYTSSVSQGTNNGRNSIHLFGVCLLMNLLPAVVSENYVRHAALNRLVARYFAAPGSSKPGHRMDMPFSMSPPCMGGQGLSPPPELA